MAVPSTTDQLLDMVRASAIHPADRLTERLRAVADLPADPRRSAAILVRHGVLTEFQAKMLLAGRSRGFTLGPYVILDQLGKGGMGSVYLAEHRTLLRRVALKVLTPPRDAADERLAVERFLREARSAAALDHPNIVRLFDVGQQGGVNYLAMEYVEGTTLDVLMTRGGPMAPSRAVGYVAQAAAGLQHAHEKGFVHRDVKPSNLILAKDGTVKILDMGLARSFSPNDSLTESFDRGGAVIGTADYIAPEQALSASVIDARSDIYSLGATFFALVTGRPPFQGTTTQKLLQHQTAEPPPLAELDLTFPEGLSAVIARMLRKRPEDRYHSAAEVIAALQPWLPRGVGPKPAGGDAVTAVVGPRDTSGDLTSRDTRRIAAPAGQARRGGRSAVKWAAVGAGALALAAGVAVAIMAFTGRRTDTAPSSGADVGRAGPPVRKSESTGPVLFRIDPAAIPGFQVRYTGMTPESGSPPPLPAGVRAECWQPSTRGEFACESVDGAPALRLTNLSAVTATQYAIELETDCGCPLEPDQDYAVRVEYRTRGRPEGYVHVQTLKYVNVAGANLEPSEDGWKTVVLRFHRPADTQVRITVGVRIGGEDVGLDLRSLEVTR